MNDRFDNSHDDKAALAKHGTPQACQTPLEELLRGVPLDTRLEIPMQGITGTHMIPVGRHCHDAAATIQGLQSALQRCIRALRLIYDETEGYADGAPDASMHDKMCNLISGIALRALDLQLPDPSLELSEAMAVELEKAMGYLSECTLIHNTRSGNGGFDYPNGGEAALTAYRAKFPKRTA